jgi:hypothetical protein
MEENRDQPLVPQHRQTEPRRFVYRSVDPDPDCSHPLRRSTDMPRPFQGAAGQLCPRTQFLKMRVYLKLN